MGTDVHTPMLTDGSYLTLMQWFSPGYPVGAFAYSHGLEQMVATGAINSNDCFRDWIVDVLQFGTGRADAILLHCGYQAENCHELADLNELARALCPSSERRMETDLQGDAFASATQAIWGGDTVPSVYPVAVGSAARRVGIDPIVTCAGYLHAFGANLSSAATRLVPLGQTEAQGTLASLAPLCRKIAEDTAHLSTDDIGSCTFATDIASMQHEDLYSRQFRS